MQNDDHKNINLGILEAQIINSIHFRYDKNIGIPSIDEIIIILEEYSLSITVDVEFDNLIFNLVDIAKYNESELEIFYDDNFNRIEKKQIVTYWLSKNSFGYYDFFTLAIGQFIPNLSIYSINNSLLIGFNKYYGAPSTG